MQGLAVVVVGQLVGYAVQRERGAADAVGHAAHCGAQEALAGVVNKAGGIVVAYHHVVKVTVAVGGIEAHDAGAEVGHLHYQRAAAQGEQVQVMLQAGVLEVEGEGTHQRHRRRNGRLNHAPVGLPHAGSIDL